MHKIPDRDSAAQADRQQKAIAVFIGIARRGVGRIKLQLPK
jgi:hypothetical protein